MKHLLLTTIAAVVLVGCGDSSNHKKEVSHANSKVVSSAALVEFALVHKDSDTLIANEITPAGYKKYSQTIKDPQGKSFTSDVLVEIKNEYGLEGKDIITALPKRNPLTQAPEIQIIFNSAGDAAWEQLVGENSGRRLAVIIDSKLILAPMIITHDDGGRIIQSVVGARFMEESHTTMVTSEGEPVTVNYASPIFTYDPYQGPTVTDKLIQGDFTMEFVRPLIELGKH